LLGERRLGKKAAKKLPATLWLKDFPLKPFKKLPASTSRPFKTFRPDCKKIAQKPDIPVKTGGPIRR